MNKGGDKLDIVVLIAHYNDLCGLYKSLSAISDREIDVLIVDDGSTDKPLSSELKTRFDKINNIHVLYLEENKGIDHALNAGLKSIFKSVGYRFIARLDCGDISDAMRFKIQKDYLEKHPDVYLVGSWARFVDMSGEEVFIHRGPVEHSSIKKLMFLNNVFMHPSVMFRVEAIGEIGFYPVSYKCAEDYAYFFKFVKAYKTAIIPEVLVEYELNPDGLSLTKRSLQIKSRLRVILDNFDYGLYAFIGLILNSVIYFIPYRLIQNIKKVYYRW